jgi:HEAT repeat protein
MVRREYLRSLVTELRRGRLDLRDFDIHLGQSALTSLAEHWEALIATEGTYPSPSVLALAGELAERGLGASVLRASRHPNARIRTTCIEALSDHDPTRLTADLVELLENKDADVRSAAVRAAIQLTPIPSDIEAGLRACLSDSDPNVRACAAAESGISGEATLMEMFASDDPITLVAALSCATSKQASLLERNTGHESPEVRATSISRLSQLGDLARLNLTTLERALGDPKPIVREAAAQALSKCDQSGVAETLASALDDRSQSVRSAAASSLASLGKPGVDAAVRRVRSGHPGVTDAALHTIATASGFDASPQLADVYRGCIIDAWTLAAGIELAPQATTLQLRFLNEAFLNAYRHKTALAFKTLCLIEDETVVRSVQRTLERGTARDRADALEILSHLADRDASDQFALLLETGGFLEKVTSAADFISPPDQFEDVITAVQRNEDKWLSMAADVYLANQNEADANDAPQNTDSTDPIPRAEIDLMQRLLALREVPLFSELSLDRLEAIHQLMHESEYLVGECVIREGDPGNDLYVLVEGELQIYKSHGTPAQRFLSTLTPIGYMGEIAILDGSARSATAIASKDSRLLSLGGEPFKEVILQNPEISFEIFKVLTARVRAAENRKS